MRHKIPLNVTIEVINEPRAHRRSTLVTTFPKPIEFQIEKIVVKGESRKLDAKWTIETGVIVWANGPPRFTKR